MRSRIGWFAFALGFSAVFAAAPASAWRADLCKTKVLRPIGLLYAEADGIPRVDLPPTIKTGTVISRVTQYVVDRSTGLTGFCAHFDTCYRATATVKGRQVNAQRLLNCAIDFKNPDKDEDTITYGLVPDPRRNSLHDTRVYQAFAALLTFGVESERLASTSVDAPRSRCARLARRAFAGDLRARTALVNAQNGNWGVAEVDTDPKNYGSCL